MGKTLTRDQYKKSKFSARENDRKLRESQKCVKSNDDEAPKKPIKKKWVPHSEIDV